jgi:hypothetical protein
MDDGAALRRVERVEIGDRRKGIHGDDLLDTDSLNLAMSNDMSAAGSTAFGIARSSPSAIPSPPVRTAPTVAGVEFNSAHDVFEADGLIRI